jgi:excisionase family DNA binding protein
MNNLELFSIEASARNLSVSPWTLRAHIKRGEIAVVRCGRRVLISQAEVTRIAREGLPSLGMSSKEDAGLGQAAVQRTAGQHPAGVKE